MVKIRHGLATLNSNNSVVYGQKHKEWVLVFLERNILIPKLSRFGEIFCFATKVVSEYDQEIPQSQTADNPLAPRGRAAQPS